MNMTANNNKTIRKVTPKSSSSSVRTGIIGFRNITPSTCYYPRRRHQSRMILLKLFLLLCLILWIYSQGKLFSTFRSSQSSSSSSSLLSHLDNNKRGGKTKSRSENRRTNHYYYQQDPNLHHRRGAVTSTPTAAAIIDIVSIGSNTRYEYLQAQAMYWANHTSVRLFVPVTESHDSIHDPYCSTNLTKENVLDISQWCHDKYVGKKPSTGIDDASWVTQRWSNYFASKHTLKMKSNPVGWLCAQKRMMVGLSLIMSTHYQNPWKVVGKEEEDKKKEEDYGDADATSPGASSSFSSSSRLRRPRLPFPDYLLLVDDDTYYNLDLLQTLELQHRNSSIPYVGAGCRHMNGNTITFAYGGFGLLLSKGTLQRLSQPLQCNTNKDTKNTIFGGDKKNDLPISTTGGNNNNGNINASPPPPPESVLKQIPAKDLQLSPTLYESSVCNVIEANLLLERPFYQSGMSLIQLLTARALAEPFSSHRRQSEQHYVNTTTTTTTSNNNNNNNEVTSSNNIHTNTIPNWTIGFCFHSDHYLAIMNELYRLSDPGPMETIQNSEIILYRSRNKKSVYRGSCLNEYAICNGTTSITCHYQTPTQMKELHDIKKERN